MSGLSRAESRSVTRKELLRAAAGLFLRDGFVATSLSDIAAAAGVTKGAVYSNFQSKEELFLALLAEPASTSEMYAPRQLDDIAGGGAEGIEAARQLGRHADRVRPSPAHVALFLEANAVALRSERARQLVAGNTRAFAVELGTGLRELFDAPDADPLTLGLIAQSLYAGLLMHGAFLDEVDTTVFETAYELLAAAARVPAR